MKKFVLKVLIVLCILIEICLPAVSGNYVDLKKYDLNDLTSFRVLTRQFQSDFENKKGSKEASDAFSDVIDYYYDFLNTQNSNILIGNVFISADDKFYKYRYSFYPFGLTISFDDGGFFFVYSNKYVYENFAPYLCKEWQELLKFRLYFDKRIIFDGRYIIPKSEVERTMRFYVNFAKKYPKFSEDVGIKELIELYKLRLKEYPFVA